jgi:hypothetical protein
MKRAVILPPLKLSFDEVFEAISKQPKSQTPELLAAGHALFVAQAKRTRDGRRFIALPHSNRIYEDDWGFQTNGMEKDGHRIGPFASSIDNWAKRL